MKKIIKNKIMSSFFFILLLSFILHGVNRILTIKAVEDGHYSPVSQFGGFYQMKKNSVDVIFLGSSHSYYSFAPQEFYNQFNIRSYNLGSSRQEAWVSYYWLKEAFRYQMPKVVVLETYYLFKDHDEPSVRKALDYMKWSDIKKEAVVTAQKKYPEMTSKSFWFSNIRFHERWKEVGEDDFLYSNLMKHYELKGNLAKGQKYGKTDYSTLLLDTEEADEISEEVQIYLDKIVSFCNDENIDLLFVTTPTNDWSAQKHNAIQKFSDERDINFYDFNVEELYENMQYNYAEDSCDANGHANIWGAAKISKEIGNILQKVYKIDAVEDEQWEYSKNFYENIKKDCCLQYETDINNYLQLIADERYTVFISAKDEATNALTDEIKINLQNLGLQIDLTDKYCDSYYAVIMPNEVLEDVDTEKLRVEGTLRDGLSNYFVVSAGFHCGNTSSIVIDGKEYSKNSRGLNFVIYNNETHVVIDSVCFDTYKDGEAKR